MKLSTRSLYGLRMLYHLALHYQQGPLQLSEISHREKISEKYLGQIVLLLRTSGLLSSVRGNQGGYLLPVPPSEISVLQVVECLEGDLLGFPEELDPAGDAPESLVATNFIWKKMRDSVLASLGDISLEAMTRIPQSLNPILNYCI
jgi:Rrf2 family protein